MRVTAARLVSSLIAVTFLANFAAAHEVQPAIADLTITGERLELQIAATLEPMIAGVDLDGLLNTNASDRADESDALRALSPQELDLQVRRWFPRFAANLRIFSGNERVTPALMAVDIPPVGDVTTPRMSRLFLRAELPDGAAPITIGWAPEYGGLVLRQQGGDSEEAYTAFLRGGEESAPVSRTEVARQSGARVFWDYIGAGYEHIVPLGVDHILFVLGLFFLSLHMRPLLWQVSAFTVAHTITLALGMLGYVSVPANIVEPLIAASIAYVGIENVVMKGMSPWRPVVVFGFGLLHGMGFASVLGDFGLSPLNFVAGLIGFNVGVEIGQLSVILTAFLLVGLPFGKKPWYRRFIATPASLAIAAMGIFWVLERTGLIA